MSVQVCNYKDKLIFNLNAITKEKNTLQALTKTNSPAPLSMAPLDSSNIYGSVLTHSFSHFMVVSATMPCSRASNLRLSEA